MNHHLRKNARLTSFLRKALKPLFILCAAAPIFAFHTASAQDTSLNWLGTGGSGGDGNWDTTTANWSVPPAGPAQTWENAGTTTAVFGGTPGTVTITGGVDLFTNGITINTGTAATPYIITSNDGNPTATNLFLVGNSTVTLGGTVGTPVQAFLDFIIQAPTGSDPSTNSLTFTGHGTVVLTQDSSGYNGSSVTVTGGATLANGSLTSQFLPSGITYTVGTGGTGGTVDLAGISLVVSNLIGDSSGTVTNSSTTSVGVTLTIGSGGSNNTYAGAITDHATSVETSHNPTPAGGLGLSITGQNGVTFVLAGSGLNTYHGITSITGTNNTLQGGVANAFSANSVVVVADGNTVDLNGFNQTVAGLEGTGNAGSGNISNAGQNNATLATLTLAGDGTTDTLTTSANLVNGASAAGGVLALTKNGAYTQVLAGSDTYTGITTVNAGTLANGSIQGFSANSAYIVNGGGILDLNGFSASTGSLSGTGVVENGSGTVGTSTPNNLVTLTVGSLVTSVDSTFDGIIRDHDPAAAGQTGTIALAKIGNSTLTLTNGANNYSGGTTIAGGILSFSQGALGPSGTIEFTANSTLQYHDTNTQDVSGRITIDNGVIATIDTNGNTVNFGSTLTATTGGLQKTGAGMLTLSADNTYSGTTTVSQGTLRDNSANGFSPNSIFVVTSPGILDMNGFSPTIAGLVGTGTVTSTTAGAVTLTINSSTSNAFTGTLQNGAATVSLTKTGTGIQTLGGTSTYTGPTLVTGGTLQAGSNTGFSAASTMTVTSPGIVDVNSFAPTVASLSGNGTVTNNATGTTGSLTTGGNNLDSAFTGSLQDGTGRLGLNKIGTGILTVSLSSYTGDTNISAGTLKAATTTAFSQNSSFNVTAPGIADLNGFSNSVGSLAGTGTVTNGGASAATLTAGQNGASTTFSGLITDGKAPVAFVKTGSGAMTLTTANTFSGGAMLQGGALVIANSQALGNGNVTVNGGNLQLGGSNNNIQVNANYRQTGGELDLRIGGTTPGTFDRLTVAGNASLGGRLNVSSVNNFAPKNGDTITVITAGGGVTGTFQQVAGTLSNFPLVKLTVDYQPNQVVLEFGQGSFMEAAVMLHLDLTPNQQKVANALDHISSNSKATRLLAFLDSTPFFSLPAAYDLIAPEEYGTIFEISRSGAKMEATTIENRLDEVHATALPTAAAGPAGPADGKGSKEIMPPPEYRLGVFANGTGEFVRVGDTSNAAGYNFDSGGVTVGVDYRFTEHFVAGVLFNYTRASADLIDNGRLNADAFRGGVYASLFGGGAYVNGFLGGAYNDYDVRRAGLGGSVRGNTNGGDFNALITTGYDVHAGGFTYGPVASFQYTYTGLSSFDETGSLDPLHVNSTKGESLLTNVGLRATYDWHIGSMVLVPEVRATWQHEYGDTSEGISSSMLLGSPAFTVTSAPIGRDSLILNAGFTLRITPQLSAYAFYDGELARTNYQANNVLVGVRSSF